MLCDIASSGVLILDWRRVYKLGLLPPLHPPRAFALSAIVRLSHHKAGHKASHKITLGARDEMKPRALRPTLQCIAAATFAGAAAASEAIVLAGPYDAAGDVVAGAEGNRSAMTTKRASAASLPRGDIQDPADRYQR